MKKLAAILAFVLVLLTFTACGSAGYEKVIKAQYEAIIEGDAEAYMACFANEEYVEYLIDMDKDDDLDKEKDVLKMYKDSIKDTLEYWEEDKIKEDGWESSGLGLGKGIKVDIEVTDVIEFNKDDIALFAKYFDEKYGFGKDTVQDVVIVEYIRRLTGEEGYRRSSLSDVLVKIDGTWYISEDLSNAENIFEAMMDGVDGIDSEDKDLRKAIGGLGELILGNY